MVQQVSVVLALFLLCGCEQIKEWPDKIREMLKPEEAYSSTLEVYVEPNTGITILIDGKAVAATSPYKGERMLVGTHTLEVRGMGYYTVSLPITLKRRELLKVPVTLRPRPVMYAEQTPVPPPLPKLPPPEVKKEIPKPVVRPTLVVDSVMLTVVAEPQQLIYLEGREQKSNSITLEYDRGSFRVGEVLFNYALAANSVLTLSVAKNFKCQKDGKPLYAGFSLAHGATRLVCELSENNKQTILFNR